MCSFLYGVLLSFFDFRNTRLFKKKKEKSDLSFWEDIQAKNAPLILKAGRGEICSHLEWEGLRAKGPMQKGQRGPL